MPELNRKNLRNLFLVIAGAIVLYWILHETERLESLLDIVFGVISPFFTGAAIAFIFNVPMRAFEGLFTRIKNVTIRRIIAVLLTFIAVALVVTLVFLLLIPQLSQTIDTLIPKIYTFFVGIGNWFTDFLNDNPELMKWVMENTELEKFDWAGLAQKAISIFGDSISTVIDGAFSAIGSVTSALMDLVISLVFAIYCLFQKENLARQGRKLLYAVLPERASDYVVRVLRLSNSTFSNFLSGQCVEVCILGTLFAIVMAIFGMPYIPLVSVVVAVTAFIPIVGAWTGCILGAFLILVDDPMLAVWFVLMFVVLQQIENNMIYPRVVGTSIGLSGMWVLVAVAVGGELMGVAGMFLMIPIASVIYTLLREWTNIRLKKRNIDPLKLTDSPPEIEKQRRGFSFKKKAVRNKQDSKK